MAEQPDDGLPVGPFDTSVQAMDLWQVARAQHREGTDQYDTLRAFLSDRLRAAGVELGELDRVIVDDLAEQLGAQGVQVVGGWITRAN